MSSAKHTFITTHDSESSSDDEPAPIYSIPPKQVVALEHPAIIQNIDRGVATFGRQPDFQRMFETDIPESAVPLYLNYADATSSAIISHNTASHNVLLKVTLPKRTGRKRKRGSDGPWQGEVVETDSNTRLDIDDANTLREKIRDNLDDHDVEVMGLIKQTHRYRALADYNIRTDNSPFMTSFVNNVVPGEVSNLRKFDTHKGTDKPGQVDIIPPPRFTTYGIPFNYAYNQNPYVRELAQPSGEVKMVNVTGAKGSAGYRIKHDEPIPLAPRRQPNLKNARIRNIMAEFEKAMAERPIWTRRSLINRLCTMKNSRNISGDLVKKCICFIGYQFKGGPWRDAIIKYGIDPRTDEKYRMYQTLIFRLQKTAMGETGQTWQKTRSDAERFIKMAPNHDSPKDSHIFDGKFVWRDGKVWQLCDITDPLLAGLLSKAEVRPMCDIVATGWFHQGLWAKCKAIMKSKIQAIHFKRNVPDSAYAETLAAGDKTPLFTGQRAIRIPLPDLHLTEAEMATLSMRKYHPHQGEMRDRKDKNNSMFVYPIKGRNDRGGRVEGESEEDEDVEDMELDDGHSPGKQLHDESRFAPVASDKQKTVVAKEVEFDFDSGSESDEDDEIEDEDDGEDEEIFEGYELPNLAAEDGGDMDAESSQSESSSSEIMEDPEMMMRPVVVDGAGYYEEEGEGDEEEYYSEGDEYGEEYDDGYVAPGEAEEFGGGHYEEEGFGDENTQD